MFTVGVSLKYIDKLWLIEVDSLDAALVISLLSEFDCVVEVVFVESDSLLVLFKDSTSDLVDVLDSELVDALDSEVVDAEVSLFESEVADSLLELFCSDCEVSTFALSLFERLILFDSLMSCDFSSEVDKLSETLIEFDLSSESDKLSIFDWLPVFDVLSDAVSLFSETLFDKEASEIDVSEVELLSEVSLCVSLSESEMIVEFWLATVSLNDVISEVTGKSDAANA
ncbi:hypothetical protein [Macrococcoides canis]|uniref:hypothetical protein n=1 Tax=Macrococcoides canis TaxID=1855823 RepID=UPI0020B739F2|nr:hypothetical protein [Macrococcus canis]UTG99937.1 hypothetical protein KFV04_10820 [Macrococcus canis]WBF53075.1 hypothetical protein LL975_01675 [Macrococcus canis]